MNRFKNWLAQKLASLIRRAEVEVERQKLSEFANQPDQLHIESPYRIINARHISIGNNVSLGPGCMINAIRRYPGRFLTQLPGNVGVQEFNPEIQIGDRVSATGFLTISAAQQVSIGDDVIIASYVFIGDHAHGHSSVDVPYKYQPLENISPVTVGQGTWIGEHVIIMPGVTIGEFAIIGANSVVSGNIPARSIAAGAPAKVVKTWSEQESKWVRCGNT